MQEHPANEVIERFTLQNLTRQDRRTLYDHLLSCESCSRRLLNSRREAAALLALCPDLVTDSDNQFDHLDFEMIESYVGDTLAQMDSDLADMHLEVCGPCSEEVRDFRESLATLEKSSPLPAPLAEKVALSDAYRSAWHGISFARLLRVSAIAAIVFLVIPAGFLVSQRNRQNQKEAVKQSGTTPIQSPSQSPSHPVISSADPDAGPSVPQTSTEIPRRNPLVSRVAVTEVMLNDGSGKITVDKSGHLKGLPEISHEGRQAVRAALLSGTIKRPNILNDLEATAPALRGTSEAETSVRALSPLNTVIAEDRPLFKWIPVKEADGYRVLVGDPDFRQAAASGDLPAATTEWRPATPLKRGAVYTWVVTAIGDEVEVSAARSSSELKFKVLDEERMKELDGLSRLGSHLALGVLYAREGMLSEAEREFQMLTESNPRSAVARNLLKQIRSWHKR